MRSVGIHPGRVPGCAMLITDIMFFPSLLRLSNRVILTLISLMSSIAIYLCDLLENVNEAESLKGTKETETAKRKRKEITRDVVSGSRLS